MEMKRVLLSCIMAIMSISMFAQKDVTTFLGIPVNGTKSEMKQKLIRKGFVPKKVGTNVFLKGEFNGTNVVVHIVTNNNKVYRLLLIDENTQSEADIKIRFNTLVSQFENNKRYTTFGEYTLPDEEDISYEMKAHNKIYEAIFYQVPKIEKVDASALYKKLNNELLSKYTEDELENPSEEILKDINDTKMKISNELLVKKTVWFRICEKYGEYYIAMYYDNEYNCANGEDL